MEDYLKIGIITASFGVKGEMKVYPTTDDPARFKKLKEVYLESKEGFVNWEVESARISNGMVLLKVKGIDAPEEIVKYRQKGLFVDRSHAVPLKKDEYYIADLIGMQVESDDGKLTGTLKDVIVTGANDVYQIVLSDGRELLLPAIHDCVLEVDPEGGRMKVHVLPGLLDEE